MTETHGQHSPEQHQSRIEHEQQPQTPEVEAQHSAEQTNEALDIEKLHKDIELSALSSQETHFDAEPEDHPSQVLVNRELKNLSYDRTMFRVRKNLSLANRGLSKVIHQPVIDSVSTATAKTLARPSGLLGGGLTALIGTSLYYYITKHYGYEYNSSIYLLLLAGGFIIGLGLEMVWFLLRVRPTARR